MKKALIIGLAAIVLAACATTPQRNVQLEQARSAVQTLSQDPLAQQAASQDLEAARNSLQQAETAAEKRQSPDTINHLSELARSHAEAGQARVAEARSRQEVARAEAERNRILMEARTREAQTAKAQAENARSEAQAAQAELARAQQQLAELQARSTDRGMVVTMGDVLFDTAQATLKPGASLILDRLAKFLASYPKTRVIIEGHTDSRGSDEYNMGLSERRAQAVATALQSRGISADQIQTLGRGKGFPVASNETPEGRQQNRRVEIVFSDSSGHFAQS